MGLNCGGFYAAVPHSHLSIFDPIFPGDFRKSFSLSLSLSLSLFALKKMVAMNY